MPQINLLPWREELRARQQKELGIMVGLVAAAAAFVIVVVHLYYLGQLSSQQQRNQFLEQQTANLDKKIEEIKDLEVEKERLLNRINVIQALQSSRPEVVHLFDALVTSLPEGVYFTSVTQAGRKISLQGVAQSNARVSSLMRQMDASEWLENPALGLIRASTTGSEELADTGIRLSDFNMTITQKKPKLAGEEDEDEDS